MNVHSQQLWVPHLAVEYEHSSLQTSSTLLLLQEHWEKLFTAVISFNLQRMQFTNLSAINYFGWQTMCNISVCQDTGEENGKLVPSPVVYIPAFVNDYCEGEDTTVKRTYFQSFFHLPRMETTYISHLPSSLSPPPVV